MRVYIVEQEFQYEPGRVIAVYGNEGEAVARSLNEAIRVADGDEKLVTWNAQRNSHEVRLQPDPDLNGHDFDCGFRVQGFPVM